MRLLTCSLVVLCVSCGAAPRPTPEVMPEVAAEYGAIYNEWDEARMDALHPPKAQEKESPRRHLQWLRGQLGACGEPQFMWSTGKRGARFTYPCEHGALEAQFTLDDEGKIMAVRSGAAGIPAPELLQTAAEAVMASLPWSYPTPRPFKHNLDLFAATRLGKCQLVRPWAVGPYGALFHAQCEHGDAAVLRLGVHEDGTISKAELLRSSDVYFGPPVSLPASRM